MTAAGRLGPPGGLRPQTYVHLIGLLACAGLRISEALRLTRTDIDLDRRVATVRQTKFKKSRLVPLHHSAVDALAVYVGRRDRVIARPRDERFFLSDSGAGLPYSTVRTVFRKLCKSLGIVGRGRRPRLHDLRHTFACCRVETWYDAGIELHPNVAALSVYLGHGKVTDTYWYLTATPDLMARAAARFEAVAPPGNPEVQP